jgi:hypothetical protein
MRFGLFAGAQAPRTTDGAPGRGFRAYIGTNVGANLFLDQVASTEAIGERIALFKAHILFGPPQEIIAGLQAPHAVGVRYVLISGGEAARQSMRRFAAEVMPALTRRTSGLARSAPTSERRLAEGEGGR